MASHELTDKIEPTESQVVIISIFLFLLLLIFIIHDENSKMGTLVFSVLVLKNPVQTYQPKTHLLIQDFNLY